MNIRIPSLFAWLPVICSTLASGAGLHAAQILDTAPMSWNSGRSDWINVKSMPYGAAGDGVADDTAALQRALDQASLCFTQPGTVYLPPGTYKITGTLYWHTPPSSGAWDGMGGLSLIGSGGDPTRAYASQGTKIVWSGASGLPMFSSCGAPRTRYFGIVWDGNGTAKCAYDHSNKTNTQYESRLRHENEAFLNFSAAGASGIASGESPRLAPTGETMVWNCLFYRCANGATIGLNDYNDYYWTFDGCEFEECGTAIRSPLGKTIVMNTHFAGSTTTDISSNVAIRVRHCTSVGSKKFFTGAFGTYGQLAILQDCLIDSWTNPTGTISFSEAGPNQILDCVFTNPPNGNSPIYITSPIACGLLLSGNYTPSAVPLVNAAGVALSQVTIPNGSWVSSLCSAKQTFLKSNYPADGPILDVTQAPYNATPNYGPVDDTAAIQQAIADAASRHDGTIVYLPAGGYHLSSTLALSGSNYSIEGSGQRSQLLWYGTVPTDPVITVNTPNKVSLSQFTIKVQNKATLAIKQTATAPGEITYDGIYEFLFGPGGELSDTLLNNGSGVLLSSLPAGSVVRIRHLDTALTVDNCGPAQILADYIASSQVIVKGATAPKNGFLGVSALELYQDVPGDWTVTIDDNQNFVAADYYSEQSYHDLRILRGSGTGSGKVSIQGVKEECHALATQLTVDNYQGNIFYGGTWMRGDRTSSPTIVQSGTNPCSLTLEGINFYDVAPAITTSSSCLKTELLNTTSYGTYRPDIQPSGWKAAAAAGLDYLRELGCVSLETKYNLFQGVRNSSAELDAINPNPSTALGYAPAIWDLYGQGAYGTGIRNVTTVGTASPFGSGGQGMLVVDQTGPGSGGSRLDFYQFFPKPFPSDLGGVFSFDFRLNSSGTINRLVCRPWANWVAGCSLILYSNGAGPGSIWANVGGVAGPLPPAISLGTWYRVRVVLGAPSTGPSSCTVSLTPWVGTGPGATTSYTVDSFNSVQPTGFNRVLFNTITPGESTNINLDNVTLKSGTTNLPTLP